MSKLVIAVMAVAMMVLVGCSDDGQASVNLAPQTGIVTVTRQDVPAVLPAIDLSNRSFGLDELVPLMTRADELAQMQIDTNKCTAYTENGAVVPGQYTYCAIDFFWNGKYAGAAYASMQSDGKILLTRGQ